MLCTNEYSNNARGIVIFQGKGLLLIFLQAVIKNLCFQLYCDSIIVDKAYFN